MMRHLSAPCQVAAIPRVDSTRPGSHRLQRQMTLRAGEVVWDLNGRSFPDWRETLPAAWRRE